MGTHRMRVTLPPSRPLDILTFCKYTVLMITDLIGHADYLQILLTLRRRKRLRFSQIQSQLKLNPAQVTRALKYLRNGLWIIPRTVPTKGDRIFVEYSLGKRGEVLLDKVIDSLRDAVKKNVDVLGASELRSVMSLYP